MDKAAARPIFRARAGCARELANRQCPEEGAYALFRRASGLTMNRALGRDGARGVIDCYCGREHHANDGDARDRRVNDDQNNSAPPVICE